MIDYIRSLGIDVTSEYTYRELDRRADDKNHPIHRFYGDDTHGEDIWLDRGKDDRRFIAYAKNGRTGEWNVPDAEDGIADVYVITPDGNVPAGEAVVHSGRVTFSVESGEARVLIMKDNL